MGALAAARVAGAGTGYGWFGQASLDGGYIIPTAVVLGRVER